MDGELWKLFTALQGWGGWAMTAVIVSAWIKYRPAMKRLSMDSEEKLREELATQRAECVKENAALNSRLDRLRERILGLRRQHVAEQLSLVSLIMRTVNVPELGLMKQLLEAMHEQLKGVTGLEDDAQVGEMEGAFNVEGP